MNPIEQQKTVFACSECKRVHGERRAAESCCLCGYCNKHRATVKEYSERPVLCERCAAAKARKQANDACVNARKRLAELEGMISIARDRLQQAEATYAALGGKRREHQKASA